MVLDSISRAIFWSFSSSYFALWTALWHAAHKWLGHIVVRNIVGCVLLRCSLFSGPIEPKQCRTKPGILKETDQETVHGGLWQVTSLSTCWKLDVLNQYLMRPCSVRYEQLSCINNFHVSNKINLTNKFKHFLKNVCRQERNFSVSGLLRKTRRFEIEVEVYNQEEGKKDKRRKAKVKENYQNEVKFLGFTVRFLLFYFWVTLMKFK